jgi:hypothetical protein
MQHAELPRAVPPETVLAEASRQEQVMLQQ